MPAFAFEFDDGDLDDEFDAPWWPSWHRGAACRGADRGLFFPRPGAGGVECVAAAKLICATCTVVDSCLAAALAVPPADDVGVFGGTTPTERRTMRAHTAAAAPVAVALRSPRQRGGVDGANAAREPTASLAAL